MRWMWIDRVLVLEREHRAVAVKNVSLAEDHLHDHFPQMPVMPVSLMIEGMAQTAGILVGHARDFSEKVILAKIGKSVLDRDVFPGQTLIYEATLERIDDAGASITGTVYRRDHANPAGSGRDHSEYGEVIGTIELMFSHIDRSRSTLPFPKHNFVFGEQFMSLLRNSGFDVPTPTAPRPPE